MICDSRREKSKGGRCISVRALVRKHDGHENSNLVGGSLWVDSESKTFQKNMKTRPQKICLAFKDNKNGTSITDLMGEDGVTDSTGESSRPLETWFEKGPNLTRVQNSAEHKKGAWVWAVLQN